MQVLNMPASIQAMCDLLEEVVKLNPSLIQVRVFFYGLSAPLHVAFVGFRANRLF